MLCSRGSGETWRVLAELPVARNKWKLLLRWKRKSDYLFPGPAIGQFDKFTGVASGATTAFLCSWCFMEFFMPRCHGGKSTDTRQPSLPSSPGWDWLKISLPQLMLPFCQVPLCYWGTLTSVTYFLFPLSLWQVEYQVVVIKFIRAK